MAWQLLLWGERETEMRVQSVAGLASCHSSPATSSTDGITSGLAGTYRGEIVAHPSLLWRIWIEDPDQLTISPYHFLFSRITECYHTRPSARSEDRSQHSQLAAGQQQRGDRLKYSESFPMEVLKLSWARRHSAHVSRRGGRSQLIRHFLSSQVCSSRRRHPAVLQCCRLLQHLLLILSVWISSLRCFNYRAKWRYTAHRCGGSHGLLSSMKCWKDG